MGSCRQTKLFHGGIEDALRLGLERAELADLAWGHPAVDGGTVGMGASRLVSVRSRVRLPQRAGPATTFRSGPNRHGV